MWPCEAAMVPHSQNTGKEAPPALPGNVSEGFVVEAFELSLEQTVKSLLDSCLQQRGGPPLRAAGNRGSHRVSGKEGIKGKGSPSGS